MIIEERIELGEQGKNEDLDTLVNDKNMYVLSAVIHNKRPQNNNVI